MLSQLETLLREETLTPASKVEEGTMICATELTAKGIVYHQWPFEKWPETWQKALMGQTKGYKIGPVKIVAIYHIWV